MIYFRVKERLIFLIFSCRLSIQHLETFYVTFVGFVGCLALICLCIFFWIWRMFCSGSRNNLQPPKTKNQVWASFAILLFMTFVWMFGLMAARLRSIVLEYVFSFTNILLGFLIFLCYCLLDTDARFESIPPVVHWVSDKLVKRCQNTNVKLLLFCSVTFMNKYNLL